MYIHVYIYFDLFWDLSYCYPVGKYSFIKLCTTDTWTCIHYMNQFIEFSSLGRPCILHVFVDLNFQSTILTQYTTGLLPSETPKHWNTSVVESQCTPAKYDQIFISCIIFRHHIKTFLFYIPDMTIMFHRYSCKLRDLIFFYE